MTVGNCQEPTDRSSAGRDEPRADGNVSASGPIIDEAALAELLELDRLSPGVFERVVRIYLDQAPTILRELRAAVAESDPARSFEAAHSLKSSSMNVGAKTLSVLCKELESLGKRGSTNGAANLLDQIGALYPEVEVALRDRITAGQERDTEPVG